MKIGVISDTHDQILRIQKAVGVFKREEVGMVIHCGDIVSPFTLQFYKELKCPIKFLFGNNTGDIRLHFEYARNFGLGNVEFGTFFSLVVEDRRIAVYHGDSEEIVSALVKCGDYDCVFSGHNHIAKIENIGGVLSLNPGTLMDKHRDEMAAPSFAIYDSQTNSAKLYNS